MSNLDIKGMLLCSSGNETQEVVQNLIDCAMKDVNQIHIFKNFTGLCLPNAPIKYAIKNIPGELIFHITDKIIKVDQEHIVSDYQKRQIPRFR